MSPGKAASQAGHAFLGAAVQALQSNFPYVAEYLKLCPGTKVCLQASLGDIQRAQFNAQRLGLPNFLVVDCGCEDFYDGEPTITALGIGPCPRHIVTPVTGKFRLYK